MSLFSWLPASMASASSLGVLAVALLATYLFMAHTHWARRGIPYARPTFMLGNLWTAIVRKKTFGHCLGDIYRSHSGSPFIGIYKFLQPIILLKDPELIKEVLVQNFSSFFNNEMIIPEGVEDAIANNPFSVGEDRWKMLRLRLSQLFSPARVRVAVSDMIESAEKLAEFIQARGENTSQDVQITTKRYTAHSSARILFGIESHTLDIGAEPGPFYDLGHTIFHGGVMANLRLMAFFLYPGLLKVIGYDFVNSDVYSFFRKLIRDSVEFRQKEVITRDDFIHYASKEILVDGKVDEAALKKATDSAINSYIETFETTSTVLTAALLLLAHNPKEQERLRAELLAAFPKDKPIQHDTLVGLPYLDQVVKESLRMYPPADSIRRACTKATRLQSGEYRVDLNEGDLVYVSADGLHYDPAYYSHPDQFWPDHFSEEESEGRPKVAYLAFGEGPRMCPGQRFGALSVKAALAVILIKLEVTVGPEQVLPIQRDTTVPLLGFKGGAWLRFRPLA